MKKYALTLFMILISMISVSCEETVEVYQLQSIKIDTVYNYKVIRQNYKGLKWFDTKQSNKHFKKGDKIKLFFK